MVSTMKVVSVVEADEETEAETETPQKTCTPTMLQCCPWCPQLEWCCNQSCIHCLCCQWCCFVPCPNGTSWWLLITPQFFWYSIPSLMDFNEFSIIIAAVTSCVYCCCWWHYHGCFRKQDHGSDVLMRHDENCKLYDIKTFEIRACEGNLVKRGKNMISCCH